MNEYERAIYKEGYADGRADAFDMMWAVLEYIQDHPQRNLESPETQAKVIAAAEKRLRAKGSKMTVTKGQ
jgi:hypothetical protein